MYKGSFVYDKFHQDGDSVFAKHFLNGGLFHSGTHLCSAVAVRG